ncbi:MAG: acyl-CoA thioesterase [Acidobacteria bacterium]|nr:acyl-CoA thioesterase [Acidobacteriota bacterium]
MKAKTVSESKTTVTEVVLPNDANTLGNILGGRVMHLMDITGAIAAFRHCRQQVVTASVDSLHFLHPIRIGQLIILESFVTRAFQTSMEVQVEIFSEDPLTGERQKTSRAYLTFVAVDESGRPKEVPPLKTRTKEERGRYREALRRRRLRLQEVVKKPS